MKERLCNEIQDGLERLNSYLINSEKLSILYIKDFNLFIELESKIDAINSKELAKLNDNDLEGLSSAIDTLNKTTRIDSEKICRMQVEVRCVDDYELLKDEISSLSSTYNKVHLIVKCFDETLKNDVCKLSEYLPKHSILLLQEDFSEVLSHIKSSTKPSYSLIRPYIEEKDLISYLQSPMINIKGAVDLKIGDFDNIESLPSKIDHVQFYEEMSITNAKKFQKLLTKSLLEKHSKNMAIIGNGNIQSIINSLFSKVLFDIFLIEKGLNVGLEKNSICHKCWAQHICWTSGAYKIFNKHPEITNKAKENCEIITSIIEKVITYSKNKIIEQKIPKKPIEIQYADFKLKLLNPN